MFSLCLLYWDVALLARRWCKSSKPFLYDKSAEKKPWFLIRIKDCWLCFLLNPASTSVSSVHVLLKPSLENFECYFATVWDESNCAVVWTFFGIAFLWDWNKNDLFQSCGHCWVFQICWDIECSTCIASSFRIFSSSAGIPSPPLALFGPPDFTFHDVWL